VRGPSGSGGAGGAGTASTAPAQAPGRGQGRVGFAVLLATALTVARPGDAGASLRASDEALARASAAAVRGRVVGIRSGWDAAAGAIYTYVTLDVARQWGLDGAASRVTVKQLGGVVGGTALVVGGQARFALGEDVLLFLEVRPRDRTLAVIGLEHGKWTMVAAAGDAPATLARDQSGLDPTAPPVRELRPAADLDLLARLAGTHVRADGARLEPPELSVSLDGPAPSADFSLLSPATPARWHEADAGVPVYVDADAGGHPQVSGGGLREGIAATALWSEAAALMLRPGVLRAPRCFSDAAAPDGRISITYGDPCGEIADSSPTLAIGGAYYTASDVRVVNGVPFWKITAGMIVTDGVAAKFSGLSPGCFADVVAHELGHAIGFGHATGAAALMFPTLSADCAARASGRPLGADDRAGAALLYPRPGPPPPGVPNGLGAAVSGDTVLVFWGAPLWGPAPTAYRLEAGSAPGASDQGVVQLGATAFVATAVPNGEYHVRVRALAGAVPGLATPDMRVVVGGPPPGPPVEVTATAAPGGAVQVSWSPPAVGTVTGYVVEVGLAPGQPTHRFAAPGTSLGGTGIPRGIYYVRVVAMNGTAASAPSAEIAVVVP